MRIKKKKDIWFVCFLGTLCIRAEEKKVKEKILNCDFKWLHTADKSLALVHLNDGRRGGAPGGRENAGKVDHPKYLRTN